jgi:hypothetical protein
MAFEPQLWLDTVLQAKHQILGALQISDVFELFRTFVPMCPTCIEIKHSQHWQSIFAQTVDRAQTHAR